MLTVFSYACTLAVAPMLLESKPSISKILKRQNYEFSGLSRQGAHQYNGRNYWLSWRDPQTANTKWDWFNARNYCRKRCMDLVSFEDQAEYEHFKPLIGGESCTLAAELNSRT